MSATHALFETASGYALFEIVQAEEIGNQLKEVQDTVTDLARFGKYIKLKSFSPFKSAADALENINDVSEGVCNSNLRAFVELNLSAAQKESNILGVADRNLAGSIKAETGVSCASDSFVNEIIRGIRLHEDKLIKGLDHGDLEKAQLGLGHAYSRAKVKFNVNKSDNMIIQAIAILDQIDKDINTFAMRTREWYSWHFPELGKLVSDNVQFCKLCSIIKNKSTLDSSKLDALTEVTQDDSLSNLIIDAAKSSMGTDISDLDMINIESFAIRVASLAAYRKSLYDYLVNKMNIVAPNLAALIGDIIGARLIAHAGSLTNLSKYPASTVQILGAEKALFRALKTKGNTPKYGLIYNSSFIGKAGSKNKGRISRYLANKATIASRIDCFSEIPTSKYGEALRKQVEEKLNHFESGAPALKNADVMAKAVVEATKDQENYESGSNAQTNTEPVNDPLVTPKKSKSKRTTDELDDSAETSSSKKAKKDKSKKAGATPKSEKKEKSEKTPKSEKKDKSLKTPKSDKKDKSEKTPKSEKKDKSEKTPKKSKK
ncbi:hypothetical protein BB560_005459 [Smittium megazygosporum]|uniref:Nucleolar protein 56 n=1 Tax=Smittium megazygosporum TaxID=133381 RepID=A0A2T9Z5A6_9FUNG|nr:hypothetical protein BB560_005459 [Smittium megazygosporum]